MFERFTNRARRVLVLAQEEARQLDHGFIGTEHILLGLIHEGDGVAGKVLDSIGLELADVRERVASAIGIRPTGSVESPPFTPRAKKVLELSLREALQLGHSYIGTEHILLGLVREGDGVAFQLLVSLGVDLDDMRRRVFAAVSSAPRAGPRPRELGSDGITDRLQCTESRGRELGLDLRSVGDRQRQVERNRREPQED